eukprot:11053822-Lingulodinium_polyedra.AAC.1
MGQPNRPPARRSSPQTSTAPALRAYNVQPRTTRRPRRISTTRLTAFAPVAKKPLTCPFAGLMFHSGV